MDLKQTVEWAKGIDLLQITEKQRHKAKCYRDMIIEKSITVGTLTVKIDAYMSDISEYIEQLAKINVKHPELVDAEKEEEIPESNDIGMIKAAPIIASSPLLP